MIQDYALSVGTSLLLAMLLAACRGGGRPTPTGAETPAATPTVPQDEHTFYVAVDGDDANVRGPAGGRLALTARLAGH